MPNILCSGQSISQILRGTFRWSAGVINGRIVLTALCLAVSGCQYFSTDSQINYGLNHYTMGLYGHAVPALVSAAKSLEKESPPDPRLVDVLIALGTMAASDKRHDAAPGFYSRALKAAEALQPTDNTKLRSALVGLGMYYWENERAREARPILQRAATISEKFQDQEFHAIDLDNLALAYQSLERYEEAIELQAKALKVVNQLPATQFPTKGTILHNLGSSYMKLGRYKEAEAYLKVAITVLTYGGRAVEPWRVTTAKESYADLLRRMARADQAKKLESAALQPGAPTVAPSARR